MSAGVLKAKDEEIKSKIKNIDAVSTGNYYAQHRY
jgi:hypothetical protein